MKPGGCDPRRAGPTHKQATGEDIGLIFSTGRWLSILRRCDFFANRHGFTGKQRFVCQYLLASQQKSISRHAIAFREYDDVARYQIAARNALELSVAFHQGARTGQVAKGFQNPFAAALLYNADRHRQGREQPEYDCINRFTQQEIDGAAAQKKREHRLPDNIENDASEFPAVGIGKFVWPELPEAGRGLGRAQPNFCCPIH